MSASRSGRSSGRRPRRPRAAGAPPRRARVASSARAQSIVPATLSGARPRRARQSRSALRSARRAGRAPARHFRDRRAGGRRAPGAEPQTRARHERRRRPFIAGSLLYGHGTIQRNSIDGDSMATEAEGKTKQATWSRGLRRLRRVSQAGDQGLLRSRLEEPPRQLHRAGDRLGAGDVDGGRLDPRRQRPQEGGAGRGRRGRAAVRPALRAVGPARRHPDRARPRCRSAATCSRTARRSPTRWSPARRSSPTRAPSSRRPRAATAPAATTAASRNLMVDGLLKRFLEELDAAWASAAQPRARYIEHERLQAADRKPDQQAGAEHVLDLAAAVLGVRDDLARLVALLRVEGAHSVGGGDLFPERAQLGRLALGLGIDRPPRGRRPRRRWPGRRWCWCGGPRRSGGSGASRRPGRAPAWAR